MIDKVVGIEQIYPLLHDGQRMMVSGFAEVGTPFTLIDALVDKKIKNITLIANDTGKTYMPGIGQLVARKQISKAIVTFVGITPEAGEQYEKGELDIELVPQGTFVERVRCGGAGIGGIYMPAGAGTTLAEGRESRIIDGKEYLFELPLRAEIALIHAYKADRFGNLVYKYTARNYNPIMATAADLVVVEAEHIVEVGEIDPDEVMTPGAYVDYIIQAEEAKYIKWTPEQ